MSEDFEFDMDDLDNIDFDVDGDVLSDEEPEPKKEKTTKKPAEKKETKKQAPVAEEDDLTAGIDDIELDDILVDDETPVEEAKPKRGRRPKEAKVESVESTPKREKLAEKDAVPEKVASDIRTELAQLAIPSVQHLSVVVPTDKLGEFYTALGGLF